MMTTDSLFCRLNKRVPYAHLVSTSSLVTGDTTSQFEINHDGNIYTMGTGKKQDTKALKVFVF